MYITSVARRSHDPSGHWTETLTVTPILLCTITPTPPTSHSPLDLQLCAPIITVLHILSAASFAIGVLPGPMAFFERTVCSFNWSWVYIPTGLL